MFNMIPLPVGIPVEFHILWWQIHTCHVWMYACVHRCSVMNCKGITSSPRSLVTRIVIHDSFGSCHARECVYDAFAYVPPKNGLIALKTPRTSRLSTFHYCQVVNRQLLRLLSTYILVYYGVMANYNITLSNIQHHWQLSIASFRFCETYLLHIKPFVVNRSAMCPFLGGNDSYMTHMTHSLTWHDSFIIMSTLVTWLIPMASQHPRDPPMHALRRIHTWPMHTWKTTDWCVLIRMTYSYAWHGVFVGFLSVCAITW